MKKRRLHYQTLFYPGSYLSEKKLNRLVLELREVASHCFSETPYYQALSGDREELKRVVITIARNKAGKILGFCSAVTLDVDGVGKVFHTGLTCVHPYARGHRLTHKLTSRLLFKYLAKESFFTPIWVSNCACVLSSLGNLAIYFEEVHPSPFNEQGASLTHLKIARTIDEKYRAPIAINTDAVFNEDSFVFEGSVQGSVFEKSSNDSRYFHRNKQLTEFYQNRLNFERGDEVLQIARIGLLSFPKYYARKFYLQVKRATLALPKKLAQSS